MNVCEQPLGQNVETLKQKAAVANLDMVSITAIQGVTAPATGGTPVTVITNGQYTGTVTWSPKRSTFAAETHFAAETQYTATITLTPKAGYTLQGVRANFFTVSGAVSVTNSANSGVITAVFPLTAATVSKDRIEYYWVDEHGSLVTTSGGAAAVDPGATLTITSQGTGYVVKQWRLNGVNTGQSGRTYSFSSTTIGPHTVGLFVEKDGQLYNTTITITVASVTVTFNINGGSGTVPASQSVSSGYSISLPYGDGFSRTGYTFGGWNTNAYGSGTNYDAGSFYTPTGNITLYARWYEWSNASGSEGNPYVLTAGTWRNGSITYGDSVWYSFSVTNGTTYRVWWNDSYDGDGTKTLDIMVTASYSNGSLIFYYEDSAWSSPQTFTANRTGTVKLEVSPYNNSGNTGTFAVVYSTSSLRP